MYEAKFEAAGLKCHALIPFEEPLSRENTKVVAIMMHPMGILGGDMRNHVVSFAQEAV